MMCRETRQRSFQEHVRQQWTDVPVQQEEETGIMFFRPVQAGQCFIY